MSNYSGDFKILLIIKIFHVHASAVFFSAQMKSFLICKSNEYNPIIPPITQLLKRIEVKNITSALKLFFTIYLVHI